MMGTVEGAPFYSLLSYSVLFCSIPLYYYLVPTKGNIRLVNHHNSVIWSIKQFLYLNGRLYFLNIQDIITHLIVTRMKNKNIPVHNIYDKWVYRGLSHSTDEPLFDKTHLILLKKSM